VSVCTFVRRHILKTRFPNFTKFYEYVARVLVLPSSGGFAICYALPVLWIASYLSDQAEAKRIEHIL